MTDPDTGYDDADDHRPGRSYADCPCADCTQEWHDRHPDDPDVAPGEDATVPLPSPTTRYPHGSVA